MTPPDTIQTYWQQYLTTLPDDHPHHQAIYSAWAFGDSPELADELLTLVLAGKKTATASAIWTYEDTDQPEPYPGELSIILDGAGQPRCIIETTELFVRPFNQVDAQFAYDEGEGDRSLQYWREGHTAFFTRECQRLQDRQFSETMPVLCERFRVIYQTG